jgi:microcin C transport system substrate-binding protein
VFSKEFVRPGSDGFDNIGDNLRQASELVKAAGCEIDPKSKMLVNKATGQPFEFEVLLVEPLFERITLPFAKNLERLGITARVRTVDAAQYKKRSDDFDYDMIVNSWGQSSSPGNEQREYWTTPFADQPGSSNALGLKDPVLDALVDQLVASPDRASLVARTHALDRVLLWGYYVIPQWYLPYDRIAFWDKFGRPSVTPAQGVQIDTWWVDPAKAATLAERRGKSAR